MSAAFDWVRRLSSVLMTLEASKRGPTQTWKPAVSIRINLKTMVVRNGIWASLFCSQFCVRFSGMVFFVRDKIDTWRCYADTLHCQYNTTIMANNVLEKFRSENALRCRETSPSHAFAAPHTGLPKNWQIFTPYITSSNVDQFSNFFHRQNQD